MTGHVAMTPYWRTDKDYPNDRPFLVYFEKVNPTDRENLRYGVAVRLKAGGNTLIVNGHFSWDMPPILKWADFDKTTEDAD